MVSTMVRRCPVSGSDICTLASRISSAGVTNSVARNTSNNVMPGPDSCSPKHERQLDLDARSDEPARRDTPAVLDEHVVEQRAVVRFVDRHRPLHHLRRQADLAALDFSPVGNLQRDQRPLHRVGVLDGHVGILERQLPDRRARLLGLIQPPRDVGELDLGGSAHRREELDRRGVERLGILEMRPVPHRGHLEHLRVRDQVRDGARGVLVHTVVLARRHDHHRRLDAAPLVVGNQVAVAHLLVLQDQQPVDGVAGVLAPIDGLAQTDEIGQAIVLVGDQVGEHGVQRFPRRLVDRLGALRPDARHVRRRGLPSGRRHQDHLLHPVRMTDGHRGRDERAQRHRDEVRRRHAEVVHHPQHVFDVDRDLVVVVRLVGEPVADHVDRHAVKVLREGGEVGRERLPVPAGAVQQDGVRLIRPTRLGITRADGHPVDRYVDEPLPELELLEIHPDAAVVLRVDSAHVDHRGRCLCLAHLTFSPVRI